MPRPTHRTKQEELQQMLDERIEDNDGDVVVEFRRFVGWFAVFCEARHLGDNGEFLGKNVTEAKRTIRLLFPL